jgi:hypothetical protein
MSRKDKKFNVLYKTTCIVDLSYYIGMHSTDNLDDGYLGSGHKLWHKIKYHGKENFRIEYLEFFKTRKELSDREIEIVNEDLLADPMCMNLCKGGDVGFTQEQLIKGAKKTSEKVWKDPNYIAKMKLVSSEVMKKLWSDPEISKRLLDGAMKSFKGKKHTDETKRKIGENSSRAQKAELNSQFGTCWIHNTEDLINKRIKKGEIEKYLQEGWKSGMKMVFFKKDNNLDED